MPLRRAEQPAPVIERRYRQHTATLVTTWAVGERRLTLTEAMVAEVTGPLLPATLLVRRLSAEGGAVDAAVDFDPRLGEQHRPPRVRRSRRALVCQWGSLAVSLGCTPELTVGPGRPTSITVTPDRPVTLVLAVAHREPLVHVDPAAACVSSPGTKPGGRPGPPGSMSLCPSATRPSAAC